MKTLDVPRFENLRYGSSPDSVLEQLAALPTNVLTEVPWSAFPYKPDVAFRIGSTQDSIVLVFDVHEKHVRAQYNNTNDPVYKDSCVEFFLSFDEVNYYNLEFNCAGIGLISYGSEDKSTRKHLAAPLVETVKTYSTINTPVHQSPTADHRPPTTTWQLLLDIPLTVFQEQGITSLAGARCRANFYKCGDELPIPHFIAWSAIDHPTPNFHLPQYFGQLRF